MEPFQLRHMALASSSSNLFSGLYTLLDYVLDGIAVIGIFFVVLGAIEVVIALTQGTRDLPSMKNAIFSIAGGFIFIGIRVLVAAMGVTW